MTCPELLRQQRVPGLFHEQRVGVKKGSCPGHDAGTDRQVREMPSGMFQVVRTLTAVRVPGTGLLVTHCPRGVEGSENCMGHRKLVKK